MTYLDKDQVLAALDGLLSHWTQEGRDSVHKLLAALPAIPPTHLDAILAVVNEQAEDEGLWCEAANIVEAYLQQELRRLHAVIENSAPPVLSRQFLDSLIATHVTATATLYEQNVGIDGDLTRGAERLRDAILESLSQEDANE